MSYAAVAERLGLPEGTVKSRIRSGMRRLARSLDDLA
jgi:DNA-directed RNA polymerase specialized sigma24 family protein